MDVVDLINFSTFSKSFNSTSWYSRLNFDLNINSNFNFELEHLILALLSYAILCYNELPYLCYLMLLYATMNFLIAENFAEGFCQRFAALAENFAAGFCFRGRYRLRSDIEI